MYARPVAVFFFRSSMRDFASTLGLANEEERVFLMVCPRRLVDVTVLREVRRPKFLSCGVVALLILQKSCGRLCGDSVK